MKNKLLKSPLKVLAATSVTIFTLLSVFTSTAAWFDSRRSLDNGGDKFEVQSLSGRLSSITFHHLSSKGRDNETGDLLSFTFNPTPVGTLTYDWNSDSASYVPTAQGDTRIELDTYDPLDKEKPLLLMFHLDQAYQTTGPSIYIDAMTNAPGFLGERDGATPAYELDDPDTIIATETHTIDEQEVKVNFYWLSSVVQFYNVIFPDDDSLSYTYALDSDYAEAQSIPYLAKNQQRFVSVNNSTEVSSFNSRTTMFSSKNGDTINTIGLVIDYFPDAIEFIYSTFLGDPILETDYDGFLHFLCDWSMEVA